jgi:hypothetical protein
MPDQVLRADEVRAVRIAAQRFATHAPEAVLGATSAFLRRQLGHGRSFSLDDDDELRYRTKLLRRLGGA